MLTFISFPKAIFVYFFFFQAEDGIRDKLVTGVQTCALPISANADAMAPVSDDLNGCWGVHHTSVDMPSPRSPSASTERGNSNALPMLATLGRKPCCAACFQNVVQSGGIGTPVTISTFSFLKVVICDEKSSDRFG